jgi:ubiquinol-cytochrome c reductase cytochrome c subunit
LPALVLVSAGVTAAAGDSSTSGGQRADTERAKAIYARDCQSCHGIAGGGVAGTGPAIGTGGLQGAGPSLRGVGAAAADLYLSTGYMPLDNANDPPKRSAPRYSKQDRDALVAYVASLGKGPPVPRVEPGEGSVREGLELFAESCAGCHQVVGKGGVVLDGIAPDLKHATATQIVEAVRVGPHLMPRFSEKQISDRQLASLVRYIEYSQDPEDKGGWELGHLGPIPEGLVAWIVAGIALLAVARFLGKRIES